MESSAFRLQSLIGMLLSQGLYLISGTGTCSILSQRPPGHAHCLHRPVPAPRGAVARPDPSGAGGHPFLRSPGAPLSSQGTAVTGRTLPGYSAPRLGSPSRSGPISLRTCHHWADWGPSEEKRCCIARAHLCKGSLGMDRRAGAAVTMGTSRPRFPKPRLQIQLKETGMWAGPRHISIGPAEMLSATPRVHNHNQLFFFFFKYARL